MMIKNLNSNFCSIYNNFPVFLNKHGAKIYLCAMAIFASLAVFYLYRAYKIKATITINPNYLAPVKFTIKKLSNKKQINESLMLNSKEEPIKHIQPNNANIDVLNTNCLTSIFKFLSNKELLTCALVNKKWNKIAKLNELWKCRFPQNIRDDFSPLVDKNILDWREVGRYIPLSHLFSEIIAYDREEISSIIKNDNAQLNAIEPETTMPCPLLKHGNYTFTIQSLTNVKIVKKGEFKPTYLKGIEGKTLVSLIAEDANFFALTEDAEIIHWNIEKQEIVQVIETAEAKYHQQNDLKIDKNACYKFYDKQSLAIKNGILALKYHKQPKFLSAIDPSVLNIIEIIPYHQPEKSYIIKTNFLYTNLLMKDNRIIFGNYKNILVYNLSTKEKKIEINIPKNSFLQLEGKVLDKNTLYIPQKFSGKDKPLYVYAIDLDAESISLYSFDSSKQIINISSMKAIDSFLFFHRKFDENKNKIFILNRKTLKNEQITFDRDSINFPSDAIEDLVKIIKRDSHCPFSSSSN